MMTKVDVSKQIIIFGEMGINHSPRTVDDYIRSDRNGSYPRYNRLRESQKVMRQMSDTNTVSTTKQKFTIKNYVTIPVEIEIEAESLDAAMEIAMNYEIGFVDFTVHQHADFFNISPDENWVITDEEGNETDTI